MKRDMDLIRLLLLKIEELSTSPSAIYSPKPAELGLTGFSDDQVKYHYDLAVEAGLVDKGGTGGLSTCQFRRLTVAGHDFVDSVRDEAIWRMTREGALKAGGWTVGLLADLGKGYLKKQIADKTGIDI